MLASSSIVQGVPYCLDIISVVGEAHALNRGTTSTARPTARVTLQGMYCSTYYIAVPRLSAIPSRTEGIHCRVQGNGVLEFGFKGIASPLKPPSSLSPFLVCPVV